MAPNRAPSEGGGQRLAAETLTSVTAYVSRGMSGWVRRLPVPELSSGVDTSGVLGRRRSVRIVSDLQGDSWAGRACRRGLVGCGYRGRARL